MKPKISVVIPVYNDEKRIGKVLQSLKRQNYKNFEIIVVDDGSKDKSPEIAKKYADKVIVNEHKGPAVARNTGIKNAKGEIVAFTDSDCEAKEDWLENINKFFSNKNNEVMMGKVVIPKSTFIGDSISALGFPAGGHVGFENMWKVSKEGFTDHLSSCNMALRKKVFEEHGMIDESFPLAGAEDSELSYRLTKNGVKIRYNAEAIVVHEPRTSLKSFIKWQITRGRSNYHFKKKIGDVNEFIKLRAWSTKNIMKRYATDPKIVIIIPLLALSFTLQQYGYFKEKILSK
ncbi:MAG: glycosyltransferase [Candidatus Nanoarchaeia archaeon]